MENCLLKTTNTVVQVVVFQTEVHELQYLLITPNSLLLLIQLYLFIHQIKMYYMNT